MREWARRHWKLLSAGAVVVLLLGSCLVKYWPSNDRTYYSGTAKNLCTKLPFAVFEPTLGSLGGEPRPADDVDCAATYGRGSSMKVLVVFAESAADAENNYYALRSALMEKDSWDLSLPVRKAQWSLGTGEVKGTVLDGNIVIVVSIFMPGTFGTIDVGFGEPMTAFLRAIVDELRKANDVSV